MLIIMHLYIYSDISALDRAWGEVFDRVMSIAVGVCGSTRLVHKY
jgi:hypothetical protein